MHLISIKEDGLKSSLCDTLRCLVLLQITWAQGRPNQLPRNNFGLEGWGWETELQHSATLSAPLPLWGPVLILKCGASEIGLHSPNVALFLELSRRPPRPLLAGLVSPPSLAPSWTCDPPTTRMHSKPHPAAPAAFRETGIHNSISFEKGLDCYCHNGRGARPHPPACPGELRVRGPQAALVD